ncbi:MAG: hypothetical protein IPO95_10340 [Rhodanobacteraceae bacterium]|nr:hypothetical protein [Rhodanobacteraceae bacterium]
MNLLEARHRQRELERATLFAGQDAVGTQAPAPDAADSGPCTIVIFEVQDMCGVIQRIGERALRRNLAQWNSCCAWLAARSRDNVGPRQPE